jgi:hypothetical protein
LLAFPQEVKVEFAVVREHNLLSLYFVDKELAEIQLEWFVLLDFCQRLICHYSVVDLVAFAFDIQNERSCFALDVASQVVVVSEFKLWLEHNFDRLV